MKPNELRAALEQLFGGCKTVERAAEALHCTERCIFYWLAGERQIPGPVISALELARACPPEFLPESWRAHPAHGAPNGRPAAQPAGPDGVGEPSSGRDRARRDLIRTGATQGAEHP